MLTKEGAEGVRQMVINHVRHEFNVDIQTEMFELIKHLANCEPFEVDGLKARANILIETLRKGKQV